MINNTIRLAAPLQKESLIDGEGIRMVLWCQGCRVRCPGCHNPETWNECQGKLYDIEEIKHTMKENSKNHNGITLTGGDPFLQPEQCLQIARYAKEELNFNVWAYCGLTYEEILTYPDKLALLRYVDILVDGPFVLQQRDITLPFRGSSNQRIIDVQESLKQNKVILYE